MEGKTNKLDIERRIKMIKVLEKLTKKKDVKSAQDEQLRKIEEELKRLNEIALALTENGEYKDELLERLLTK
jgi:hypothetical protein